MHYNYYGDGGYSKNGSEFVLLVVLFILLIIVGTFYFNH
ncbi:YjcZ family sporulation protein [Ureibacillus sp. Re31]|uniref:YjcZ family sporulation protein n=1 Tax=Ureibacillus galli TaxID=2762222 RepID=A0ABR8XF24_9BACL|nr:YjcZ family sporulation protein [Ureibacillus galli]MBD8027837.1 YjcZ family sporulation protein [Ureibacillus galli]